MPLETETLSITLDTPSANTVLPTQGELTKPLKDLVNLPSQIECKACYEAAMQAQRDLIKQKADEVRQQIEQIKAMFGKYPLSAPMVDDLYPDLVIPEEEIEKKITAAMEEFHTFVLVKILELISTVIPISQEINILGIQIDIIKFFSTEKINDPAKGCINVLYSECVKIQVRTKIDVIWDQIPDFRKKFDGDTESLSKRVQVAYEYICEKIKEGGLGFIKDKMLELISTFDEIWNTLSLPGFPNIVDILTFDVGNYIKSLTDPIMAQIDLLKTKIKEAQDKLQAIRDGTNTTDNPADLKELLKQYSDQLMGLLQGKLAIFLNMQLFGYSIKDIMGILQDSEGNYLTVLNDSTENIERQIEKLTQSLMNFPQNYAKKLINDWMAQVQSFFNAIGLGDMTQWVNFTFKDFLQYLGVPLNFQVEVPKCPYAQ